MLCHGPLVALLISLECSKLGMTGKTEDSSGILAQKWSQLASTEAISEHHSPRPSSLSAV